MQRAMKDILAGLVFIAFGLAFAGAAASYEIGTTVRMGPGFFPLALGSLLSFLGLVVIVKGFVAGEGGLIGTVPWKATFLIAGAILFFGLTIRGLGMVPSLFVTVALAAFASDRTNLLLAAIIAAGLTTLCVLIFVVALGLRLSLIGPWLGGV